ncbi:MAG: BREX system Lon protease-like protein BrxL [Bacteroidales bacterium]|nr:BREX system Lon protease-like protein BrxL [Candidatus Colimorpha merdihippi]
MSTIGEKIKQVFGSAAVYKNPANYEVFNGRNLPSFVKDYLISSHIAADGSFKREALSQFLDAHIPKDNSAILARLRRGETLTLLTRFVVTTSLAQNKTSFQIPDMGIKASDTLIPDYLIEEYPDDLIDGEKWGIMKIVYMAPVDNERGHVEMVKFKPFRPMQKLDINYIRNCRAQFTLEEWIDVLISAMEYTPTAFAGLTQKLEFLTRLLPFIEPRLNLIELAPKGTGKSYVFGNLSKFVWLVSGGKVSRAKLVYDKSTKSPGIMRFYDMVAFDEIQTITFSDNSEMQSFLKNYLEYGRATIDNYEFMSECGLMLLGNIQLSENNEPLNYKYFNALPEVFKESALLDRFHGMIEGWLLPRVNVDMALQDWTLNVEFFSEVLHQMRTESIYSQIVDDLVDVPQGADMRHTKAIKRTATAYFKLLFPHIVSLDQVNIDDFNLLCLQPAIRRRDIIRQQCSYIDNEPSFSKPIPEYRIKGLSIN